MRKVLLTVFAATSVGMAAQGYYKDVTNPEILHEESMASSENRREFVLPERVNGLIPLKYDLHIHTNYSDGECTPAFRVREAWLDGLDGIAITDHIEYRPNDRIMASFLNTNLPDGHMPDLNKSVKVAQDASAWYGLVVIPGTEITRNPNDIGHFNALFTTDNNLIPDADPLKAIRNAKAQGALVQYNHPGWARKTVAPTPVESAAQAEGLIDGIEIMNTDEFYPAIVDRAFEYNAYPAANTDIHGSTAEGYGMLGQQRNMTIIFARENTLEAVREALEKKQTLAYWHGTLAGNEQLLKDLFVAGVKVKNVGNRLLLTNTTSLRLILQPEGGNRVILNPMSSVRVAKNKEGEAKLTILNWFSGSDSHPTVICSADK